MKIKAFNICCKILNKFEANNICFYFLNVQMKQNLKCKIYNNKKKYTRKKFKVKTENFMTEVLWMKLKQNIHEKCIKKVSSFIH